MMYTNKMVLSIKRDGEFLREENSCGERRVFLPFGSEYSIYLKNKHASRRAKFKVRIDGKLTSPSEAWFIVNGNSSFELERFMLDGDNSIGKKFKFVPVESTDEEPGAADNGIVEVLCQLENVIDTTNEWTLTSTNYWYNDTSTGTYTATGNYISRSPLNMRSYKVSNDTCARTTYNPDGVTVGGSKSCQQFVQASDFETNEIVNLRLKLMPVKANMPQYTIVKNY